MVCQLIPIPFPQPLLDPFLFEIPNISHSGLRTNSENHHIVGMDIIIFLHLLFKVNIWKNISDHAILLVNSTKVRIQFYSLRRPRL